MFFALLNVLLAVIFIEVYLTRELGKTPSAGSVISLSDFVPWVSVFVVAENMILWVSCDYKVELMCSSGIPLVCFACIWLLHPVLQFYDNLMCLGSAMWSEPLCWWVFSYLLLGIVYSYVLDGFPTEIVGHVWGHMIIVSSVTLWVWSPWSCIADKNLAQLYSVFSVL